LTSSARERVFWTRESLALSRHREFSVRSRSAARCNCGETCARCRERNRLPPRSGTYTRRHGGETATNPEGNKMTHVYGWMLGWDSGRYCQLYLSACTNRKKAEIYKTTNSTHQTNFALFFPFFPFPLGRCRRGASSLAFVTARQVQVLHL
jgi:hypothetical protein